MRSRRLSESQIRSIIKSEVRLFMLNESLESSIESAADANSSKIERAAEKLPPGAEEDIAKFLMDTFGTDQPEISVENAKILAARLGLDKIQENEEPSLQDKPYESLSTKALVKLGRVLGWNANTLGIPLAAVLAIAAPAGLGLAAAGAGLAGGMIVAPVLLSLLNRLTKPHGYDVAIQRPMKSDYNPALDKRDPKAEYNRIFKLAAKDLLRDPTDDELAGYIEQQDIRRQLEHMLRTSMRSTSANLIK